MQHTAVYETADTASGLRIVRFYIYLYQLRLHSDGIRSYVDSPICFPSLHRRVRVFFQGDHFFT